MGKRLVLLAMLLLIIGIPSWADEIFTGFSYNGIVVLGGVKYAVDIPDDGNGIAMVMGIDDTAAARGVTRGIKFLGIWPEDDKPTITFKESDLTRIHRVQATPPGFEMFAKTRTAGSSNQDSETKMSTRSDDPDKEYTCEIKVIGYMAFANCNDLETVNIPSSITTIWPCAFEKSVNLKKVTIPESVKFLGGSAFAGCTSLTTVNLPTSLSALYGAAFENCTSLTTITIPDGIEEIPMSAFYGCTNLSTVQGGKGVKKIQKRAFENCYKLKTITLYNSLDSICEYAFYMCNTLTNITIPKSLTGFGKFAFGGCI